MKPTAHQRGYGTRHQRRRRQLLSQHTDGNPCPLCGKPMYKDPHRNFDNRPLEADHTTPLSHFDNRKAAPLADRLTHSECNRRRGNNINWTPEDRPKSTTRTHTWE